MKNNYLKEVIVSLILIAFAILLVNPFMFWMPTAFAMATLAVFAVIFFAFASLIFKESSGDEREDLHKLMAGRIAYLVGSGVLVLGIIVQSFAHRIDPWLVVALTVMVLAKVIAVAYRNKTS
jgi:hypothetical protein